MEDQDSYYGDCDAYHVSWICDDESGAGWKNCAWMCVAVSYMVFLLEGKDSESKSGKWNRG